MKLKKTEQPFKTPFFYGWFIVFIGGLALFFSGPGQTYSISVFINSYIEDFGWSRSMVSSLYSVATISAGFILIPIGRLIDKHGQRTMAVVIGLLLALACLWNSAVSGPVTLFFGFFMIRLFGQGSMVIIPSTLIPRWFITKRGRALSFMTLGIFVSSALLPPLNTFIINKWSWSAAWQVWALLILLIFLPLAALLIRDKPEDIELLPDGKIDLSKTDKNHQRNISYDYSFSLNEAIKTRTFWLVLVCVATPALINTALTFHLVSILGERGLEPLQAAAVLSTMAVSGFPFSLLAGYIADRAATRISLFMASFLLFCAVITLLNVNSLTSAIFFGIIWGAAFGFERVVLNAAWANYFGRNHLGGIKGVSSTTGVVASSLGPLPVALAYDHFFGGYNQILLICLLLPVASMVAAYFSSPPKKEEAAKSD